MGVLERVTGLTGLIQAEREAAEAAACLSEKVVDALAEAGVLRAVAPVEVNGHELSLPDQVRLVEALGYADPSVAWCVMNSWGSGLIAGFLTAPARQRLLADPDVLFGFGLAPGGRAVETDQGFELSGRWPVVSGCERARWFALNSLIVDRTADGDSPRLVDGAPVVRFLLVRADAVEVERTWDDVSGLRGSGSHAVRVAGADVAADLAVNLFAPPELDRPAFRIPLLVFQLIIGAALVGAARGAVDALIDQAGGRVSAVSGQAWREWPNIQDTLASELASVRAAKAGLVDVAEEIWLAAHEHRVLPNELRAAAHSMTDHAHRSARQAVSRLYTAGSIDALHRGHGLERALRDVHAMSVNWERFRQVHYDAGRVLLGLDPISRLF
ncbi:MAG: acyl-CoA dehydrogenase family protein [Acidimicrobiales bacterium]